MLSATAVFFVLFLVILGAWLADHYSRLQNMGWAPPVEDYKKGRSLLDPVGSALGEIGRADGVFNLIAAVLGPVAKATEMIYAAIGAVLSAITGFGLKR
jgi:hypothetical protein